MNDESSAIGLRALASAKRVFIALTAGLLVLYSSSGLTIVRPGEAALLFRFGVLDRDEGVPRIHASGLIWALPAPFDRVFKVSASQERNCEIKISSSGGAANNSSNSTSFLLCGDRSVVELNVAAKYRISDPAAYYFHCANDELVVRSVVRAAVTRVAAESGWDEFLRVQRRRVRDDCDLLAQTDKSLGDLLRRLPTDSKFSADLTPNELDACWSSLNLAATSAAIAEEAKEKLLASESIKDLIEREASRTLSSLNCGLTLTSVDIKSVLPPAQAAAEFKGVETARIDQETSRQRALGESRELVIEAEALALQTIAEAKGALHSRSAEASVAIERFNADLARARGLSPELGRERLRQEAWRQVLAAAERIVVVDGDGTKVRRFYLPLTEAKP